MSDKKAEMIIDRNAEYETVVDGDNWTYKRRIGWRHSEDESYGKGPWKAIERPVEKTEEEKVKELLLNNTNMPFPDVVKTVAKLKAEGVDLKTVKLKSTDKKGHLLKPSNGKKYWREIRKQRRLKK